jgi:hypothetical protein
MKNNQKGFGALEGILIVVIVGLLGFIGWYVWHSKKSTDKTYNAPTIASTVPTNKTSTPPKEQALIVTEWGVKVPTTSASNDLSYSLSNLNAVTNAKGSFRTKQLDTLWPSCTTNSVIILRGQDPDTYPSIGTSQVTFKEQYDSLQSSTDVDWAHTVKPKKIGDYYYIQSQPGAVCSTKSNGDPQENQIIQSIKDALNNLEAK